VDYALIREFGHTRFVLCSMIFGDCRFGLAGLDRKGRTVMRTRIGIVGAGPSGLLLSHLLHLNGVESIILEARSREYCENRIRAGVLEHSVARLLIDSGVGARLLAEGMRHDGINLRWNGRDHRIDLLGLTGKSITVYSQHRIVQDLIAARLAAGGQILFEAANVAVHDFHTENPHITFDHDGEGRRLDCDFIAGCDGFHGVCRDAIPAVERVSFDKDYPFGWLGILADAVPASHEVIYARHDNGFALLSMRSPSVSRLYLQCAPDEDIGQWSDARIWAELQTRLGREGFRLNEGPITQKGVTPMRSFVCEPMQSGRLFLLGDAAHIVPPTGAKGLNLAVADVAVLTRALVEYLRTGAGQGLEDYTRTCLRRVWKAQRFSWWMTSMLHRFDDDTPFESRVRLADLDTVFGSEKAAAALAENYVGLPLIL
jgi:p-hydroxybenzoate 3-monooxygenase